MLKIVVSDWLHEPVQLLFDSQLILLRDCACLIIVPFRGSDLVIVRMALGQVVEQVS